MYSPLPLLLLPPSDIASHVSRGSRELCAKELAEREVGGADGEGVAADRLSVMRGRKGALGRRRLGFEAGGAVREAPRALLESADVAGRGEEAGGWGG